MMYGYLCHPICLSDAVDVVSSLRPQNAIYVKFLERVFADIGSL